MKGALYKCGLEKEVHDGHKHMSGSLAFNGIRVLTGGRDGVLQQLL